MAESLLRVVGAPPLRLEAWAPSFPVPVADGGKSVGEDGISDPPGPGYGPPDLTARPSGVGTGQSGAGSGPADGGPGPQGLTATPSDPWPLPPAIAQTLPRPGPPGGLIALLQAAPTEPESLVTALMTDAGNRLIAVSLSPSTPPIDEPRLTAGLIAERLAFLTERADLVLLDLGCRWAPALFRPILTTADEIWLIGPTGAWTAFEARLAQAEFSGWTDLKRLHLIALGPAGAEPPPPLHSEPIQVLETPAEITRFAQSCWRRRKTR